MPNLPNDLAELQRSDIASMELPELEAALDERGHPRFHARQIFHWIYAKGVADFERMTDLSKTRRAELAVQFRISTPSLMAKDISTDAPVKFLLGLEDQRQLESVFIPDTPSQTFCISRRSAAP